MEWIVVQGVGGGRCLQRNLRVMSLGGWVFCISVAFTTWVYTCVKTHQIVSLKGVLCAPKFICYSPKPQYHRMLTMFGGRALREIITLK